jgi:hypothetical protein
MLDALEAAAVLVDALTPPVDYPYTIPRSIFTKRDTAAAALAALTETKP